MRDDLQTITLDDFSPGIWDDWNAGGGAFAAPSGAAQRVGTYGCVSGRGGGLMAAPLRVSRISQAGLGGTQTAITSFRALSPVWDRTGAGALQVGIPRICPDQLFFGFEWYAAGSHNLKVRLYKVFAEAAVNPTPGTYDIISAAVAGTSNKYGYTSVDLSRSNSANNTLPGYSIAACMLMSNNSVTTEQHKCYPDDQANGTDSSRTMVGLEGSGGFACYALMGHQDRVVGMDRSVNFGMGANGELPTDMFLAAAVNDITTRGVALENFVAENPGLMGAWCSVNASEAFFVKQQRGGFSLRGDFAYPTVVRLPSLPPTFDAINVPCVAGNGAVVYGSRTGAYAWSGGDTAKKISGSLDGWFWNTGETGNHLHTKGQFAPFKEWVAAPNNWLYNTETGGWWRLTNPAAAGECPYAFMEVSAGGYLIGAPALITGARTVLADYYDFEQGQTAYSWVSQPLRSTKDRLVDFRSITLIAQGAGTVTITVTGIEGTSDQTTFTLTATAVPEAQRLPIGVKTHDAVVTIAAASGSAAAAPRVHRVSLHYHDRQSASAVTS